MTEEQEPWTPEGERRKLPEELMARAERLLESAGKELPPITAVWQPDLPLGTLFDGTVMLLRIARRKGWVDVEAAALDARRALLDVMRTAGDTDDA